jgi:hypothetical protein
MAVAGHGRLAQLEGDEPPRRPRSPPAPRVAPARRSRPSGASPPRRARLELGWSRRPCRSHGAAGPPRAGAYRARRDRREAPGAAAAPRARRPQTVRASSASSSSSKPSSPVYPVRETQASRPATVVSIAANGRSAASGAGVSVRSTTSESGPCRARSASSLLRSTTPARPRFCSVIHPTSTAVLAAFTISHVALGAGAQDDEVVDHPSPLVAQDRVLGIADAKLRDVVGGEVLADLGGRGRPGARPRPCGSRRRDRSAPAPPGAPRRRPSTTTACPSRRTR